MFQQEGITMVLGIVAALAIIAVVIYLSKRTKEVGGNTADAANKAITNVFGEVGNNGSGSKTGSGSGTGTGTGT